MYVQYGIYLQKIQQGNFGESFRTRRPVIEEIGRTFLSQQRNDELNKIRFPNPLEPMQCEKD